MKSHTVKIAELMVPLRVKKLNSGDYLATSVVLHGLVAQGRTIAETLEIAQDVARKLIESYVEHDDPLPAFLKKQISTRKKTSHFQIPVAVNF